MDQKDSSMKYLDDIVYVKRGEHPAVSTDDGVELCGAIPHLLVFSRSTSHHD